MVKIENSGGGGTRPLPSRAGRTAAAPAVSANIKVAVRVRPTNEREQGANSRVVVQVVDERVLIFDPKEEVQPFYYQGVQQQNRNFLKRANKELKFMFDSVFSCEANNEDIFKGTTKEILSALMDGFNCSVFVYGATGAGKTFTMIGSKEQPGITYLTMDHLFAILDTYQSEREFDIHISYLEVYNENVFDLLKQSKCPLQLREDSKFGVMVAGLTLTSIRTARELLDMLEHGNRNRTQHPTDANAESSRSHAVFQVYVKMRYKTSGEVRIVKLSMIDLAGSERASATGCVGDRFKEGANINRSLLSLGNCINKLADGCKYIPYRDSKLTRLLKDSLGGNCQTIMIANVSPASPSYEDTYNTLKYAARANKIQMNIKKNIVECDVHMSQYVKIIEELRNQVKELKAKLAIPAIQVKKEIEPAVDKTKLIEWQHRLEKEYDLCGMQETRLLSVISRQRLLMLRQHAKKQAMKITMQLSKLNGDSRVMEQFNEEDIPRQARSIDSFTREINNLHTKWHSRWAKWNESKTKMSNLFAEALAECPALSDFVNTLKQSSEQKFLRARLEHQKKVTRIHSEKIHSMESYLTDMPNMMNKLFLILLGYKKNTPELDQEYKDLTNKAKNSIAVSFEIDQETNIKYCNPVLKFTTDLDLDRPTDLPINLLNDIIDEGEPTISAPNSVSDSDNLTDLDSDNPLRKRKATPNAKLYKPNETIIIEDSFTDLNGTKVVSPSPAKKALIDSFVDNIAIGAENFNNAIDPNNLNSTFVMAGKLEGKKLQGVVKPTPAKKVLFDRTNTQRSNFINGGRITKPTAGRAFMYRKPDVSTMVPSVRPGMAFGSTISKSVAAARNIQVRGRERMQTHPYSRPLFNNR